MNYTLVMLFAYAVVMLGATLIMTKKEDNIERFCVGNRNTGWVVSALSIAATWIWAPALFTSTENAYTKGFAGFFWFLVPNVLCLLFFIPFAKRIRGEMPEGITLSGYMYEKYQSEAVKNIYLFQLGMLSILSTGVQLLAGSKILSMLTGIPFAVMTVAMAAIAYSYSQFSGIKASMLTDAIQMVLMLAVSVCFVVFGIKNGAGLEIMIKGLGEPQEMLDHCFHREDGKYSSALACRLRSGSCRGRLGINVSGKGLFALERIRLAGHSWLVRCCLASFPCPWGFLALSGPEWDTLQWIPE